MGEWGKLLFQQETILESSRISSIMVAENGAAVIETIICLKEKSLQRRGACKLCKT